MRKRPRIAFDQHWEFPDHGFRNAAGAGLADQKICGMHQFVHFLCEANNVYGHFPRASTQLCGQLFVAAADQHELQRQIRGVQAVGDVIHDFRTMPAEENDCRSEIWAQPHLFAQLRHIVIFGHVEIGAQDHS